MKEETQIIHNIPVDPLTGSIGVPVYQTSTFVQDAPGVNKGFDYARSGNPTRKVLEDLIAKLEKGTAGFAFASGLAAIDAVLKLLKSGDEIIAVDDIYGGTYRLFTEVYQKFGIKVTYVDTSNPELLHAAITDKTKFIWLETPTNPTLKITDISKIAEIASTNDIYLVVDNTFTSPVLQKPLTLGADIVIHSATKYLAGHSDVIAGLVAVSSEELAEKVKFYQNASGGILGPWDSWLTIRGIETLALRVYKQCDNAFQIAHQLAELDEIDHVFYPGLKDHKNHRIAAKQQKKFGGMISFYLKDNRVETAEKIVCNTHLFKLAESLGGVKSLICHPASMTHKATPEKLRKHAGIEDSLIRISVGIEDPEDLVDDLKLAIKNAVNKVLA